MSSIGYEKSVLAGVVGGGGQAQATRSTERRSILAGQLPNAYTLEPTYIRTVHDGSTVTILEVPAGVKFLHGSGMICNSTVGALTYSHMVDVGNGDQRLGPSQVLGDSVSAGALDSLSPFIPLVLEAGDKVRITADAGLTSIVNGWFIVPEAPIRTIWLELTSTAQVLYEAPDGMLGVPVVGSSGLPTLAQAAISMLNNTGGAVNVTTSFVPAGEELNSTHQVFLRSGVANNSTSGAAEFVGAAIFRPGDRVMQAQSTDDPGFWVRITVLETFV